MRQDMRKYKVFTKSSWDKPAVLFYLLLLFTSILYAAIFTPSYASLAQLSGVDSALVTLYVAACFAPLLFIVFLNKWVAIFVTPLLFYVGSISSMYNKQLGEQVNPLTAPMFFNTEAVVDIATHANAVLFITAMFLTGAAIGVVRALYTSDNITIRKGQAFAVIFIVCVGAINVMSEKFPSYVPMPYAFFAGVQDYIKMNAYTLIIDDDLKGADATKTDDVITVVVLLDKFSNVAFDHVAINDDKNLLIDNEHALVTEYAHEKTPPILELEHLMTYDNVSLMSTFNNAQVPTEWITLGSTLKATNSIAKHYAELANNYTTIDNTIYPNPFLAIDKIKEFASKNDSGLVVVNIEGTPQDFGVRYPDTYKKSDDYTNYTAFIDAFLYEVINYLKDYNTNLIAIPLGAETKAGLDKTSVILWQSDSVATDMQLKDSNLILKTGDMFYTILGCSGLKTNLNNNDMGLCD